ncbi:MAG: DUF1592 domain-containing protein [Polyangiaceae bacterium]|nr:DUF1592 domain-containing protein [Polyangiaceae bacterium]
MTARWAVSLGALALAIGGANVSCTGDLGGDDPPPGGADGPADVEFAGMRRMTPDQYEHTMRDLFGDPELALDLDEDSGQVITLLAVDKLNAAAEAIVARRSSWTASVFPCDTAAEEDAACVDAFIRSFGRRAYRRTLEESEVQLLQEDYARAREALTFEESLLVVLKIIIQSPEVYYFLETGRLPAPGDDVAPGVFPLTGWERASRLSYFLWDTMPDDELLDAAESGDLDTAEGIRVQAERLLEDPRARATVVRFFSDWLELDGSNKHSSLADAPKSGDIYPEDSPALRAAMRVEIEALVERVLFEQNGSFEALLTSTDAYVDGPLAKLYGVSGPEAEGDFQWVTLPADQRAGLFTRAGFLTVFAGNEVKSPIRRGAYILEGVLCATLGPPPPNASDVPVKGGTVDENGTAIRRTIRQDVEAKTSTESCSGCHSRINPIGFAFEHYDALGRWQATETGEDDQGPYTLDVDATGVLPASGSGETTEVDGAVEMSEAIAKHDTAYMCLSEHLFETALRRLPVDRDLVSIETAMSQIDGDSSVTDMVVALTTSNAFLHTRRAGE